MERHADGFVNCREGKGTLEGGKADYEVEFDLPEEMVNPDSVVLGEVVKQIGSEAMILEIASQKRQNIQMAREVF